MEERIIIEKALENWQKQTGIQATWQPNAHRPEADGQIEFTYAGEQYEIAVEIKREIRAHQLTNLLLQKKQLKKLLVVAEYIYPKLKEELRAEGIGYLETNGNVYFKEDNLFLWIDNEKTEPRETAALGRAFGKTGLKLLFHFMLEEDLLNLTYREMADRTGIGFGNINFILKDLKEQGFLLPITKDTYKLTRKDELLGRWVQAYREKLKPALALGIFRFVQQTDYLQWRKLNLDPGETFWGGEPAGGILTNHLQPEQYTLYTTESRTVLMKKYRLVPDKLGDIKVYLKFWKGAADDVITVPPLLVYADLIGTGERRNLQTAERIYNEYLQATFRTT